MRAREVANALLGERRAEPPPLFDLLSGRWNGVTFGRRSSIGYDEAQTHGAVYACVDLLVRLVAWQMPAYIGDSLARPTVITDPHPEPQMMAQHWRAEALQSAVMRGFAAGLVTEFEPSGWPRKIQPLHPDLVSWSDQGGRWRWWVGGDGSMVRPGEVELWQSGGSLWIAPSPRVTPGQPVGTSVLRYAAQKINLGLSATKFGGDFFDAGGLPVAHGKITDNPNVTETQAKLLKQRILETTRNREPLITGSAFDLSTIDINAEESQFLETIQANDAQVCMFFGIPPEAIGGTSASSMTYDNLEAMNLRLLTNTVGAWMHWFEALYTSMIPGSRAVSLDPESLLRTSVATLFTTAQVGLAAGILTRDEARAMVGYQPGTVEQNGMTVADLALALQKIYLSVGTVITTDEAREILNREGAGLVVPAPPGAKAEVLGPAVPGDEGEGGEDDGEPFADS